MAEDKRQVINATVDENGKVVPEKEKFSLNPKKAWAKAPGWMKKAVKIAGVITLAAGAYVLGTKGKKNDTPDVWEPLPDAVDSSSEETTETEADEI